MNLSNFKNSKVLITGHTGFKGTWLSMILLQLGAKITGISNSIPSEPSFFELSKIKNSIDHNFLNLISRDKLNEIINNRNPDYIFHLAGQSLLTISYEDPINTWQTNLTGTINMLESIRSLKKECVAVFITSDKCYQNLEREEGYVETDTLGGIDPYSASKASAEIAINSYVKSFFNLNNLKRIGVARAGNVIGGGDWAKNRIVPDCMRSWSQNHVVEIRNPQSTRPWQHVLEPLSGYLNLALNLKYNSLLHGEAFNFGPPDKNNFSVGDLVDKMSLIWGSVRWQDNSINNNKLYESKLLKLNSNKAYDKLGWSCSMDFDYTLSQTVNWYKGYYDMKDSINEITKNQIEDFFKNFKGHGLKWDQ